MKRISIINFSRYDTREEFELDNACALITKFTLNNIPI